jgi:predicted GIY-YIG superfamily endonuclease
MNDSYIVYILQDATGAYYVGYTEDLAARIKAHQAGQGGIHTQKLLSP